MIADIVVGLQHGDEAKGKVTHHLCKDGDYTHVLRFNGGGNAGHTIFHNGKKFVTHYIPAGVFYGITSVIGSGCVINSKDFFNELEELRSEGIDTSLVKIAKNCHIITESHQQEDRKDEIIGTTKKGNGPAYRSKYERSGIQAKNALEFKPFLIDLFEEFHNKNDVKILCEGAQGFELDIDWGDYPYVTSSHCIAASALLNGIPPQAVRNIWGVGKMYDTYVGQKQFEPNNDVFPMLREVGQEYGATTGRPRQCNWLNLDSLNRSLLINGVTHMVLNKLDVLEQVDKWSVYHRGETINFSSKEQMCDYIVNNTPFKDNKENVIFSGNKHNLNAA